MTTDTLSRRDQLIQRLVTAALLTLAASLVGVGVLFYL